MCWELRTRPWRFGSKASIDTQIHKQPRLLLWAFTELMNILLHTPFISRWATMPKRMQASLKHCITTVTVHAQYTCSVLYFQSSWLTLQTQSWDLKPCTYWGPHSSHSSWSQAGFPKVPTIIIIVIPWVLLSAHDSKHPSWRTWVSALSVPVFHCKRAPWSA